MKRKMLTEPQYRLLKRMVQTDSEEVWAGGARDRTVAGRLERIDCLDPLGCQPGHWRVTDHGRNILDLHRSFFEPSESSGEGEGER